MAKSFYEAATGHTAGEVSSLPGCFVFHVMCSTQTGKTGLAQFAFVEAPDARAERETARDMLQAPRGSLHVFDNRFRPVPVL